MAKKPFAEMTFTELMDEYLGEVTIDESSAEQYRATCSLVRQWCGQRKAAVLFSKKFLVEFRNWLTKQGRSPETVKNKLRHFLMLWRYANDDYGFPVVAPSSRRINPQIPRRLPEAWTTEEFNKIRQHVEAAPQTPGWTSADWEKLLDTLWYTAARITAILDVRVKDIDGNWLTLSAESAKTLTEQKCELPADLAARLVAGKNPDDLVFKWPMTIETLRQRYRSILSAAGLPSGRRDLLHKIRRTSATFTANAHGIEAAARLLGHTSSAMTIRNYLDPQQLTISRVMPPPIS